MNILQHLPDYVREFTLLGNTGEALIIAGVAFLLFLAIFRTFHHTLLWRLEAFSERTAARFDDVFVDVVKQLRGWFYIVLSIYIALWFLEFSTMFWNITNGIFIVLVVYQIVQSIGIIIEYLVVHKISNGNEEQAAAIAGVLTKLAKGLVWILAFLFILSNLGINITSLITGLGIGGIAVALALQNILSDLFSSFSIYFDKPFQVGDFIVVGDQMGTVETIGIKSTRLRALSGEEIILSNRDLTSAQVHNYRDMDEFRAEFSVGVSYETSADKLDTAKEIIADVITSQENVRLDFVNINRFEDSSITFDAAFYTKTADYYEHLATRHNVLREVKRQFDKKDIEIAFPTRTVYLHK